MPPRLVFEYENIGPTQVPSPKSQDPKALKVLRVKVLSETHVAWNAAGVFLVWE